jgi:calcineurin-like phosphoesterase family protein
MSIFISSDLHLGHSNIIKYCNRPFSNVKEMDETIISNWNFIIKPSDTVYNLGDFCFGNVKYYKSRLNGDMHFITGSHDKNTSNSKNLFASYSPLKEVKIEDKLIVLCHYSLRTWAKSHYNSWHCYGHSHSGLPVWGKSFFVGVDGHNFFPWSWEEVKEKMNTLPDNFNLVKERKYE